MLTKKNDQYLWLILTVSLIMLVVSSWLAVHKFEKHFKENIAEYLNAINESANQSFGSWLDRQYAASAVWAREVIPVTKELIKLPQTRNELVNSAAQVEIRRLLRPLYTGGNYEGFFIIGPGNINLASSRDNNIGVINILAEQQGVLQRMWSGETFVISTPLPSDVPLLNEQGKLQEKRATMFVGTPVKDESGTIIAILTLRINPARDFTGIFETARMGINGETYCIDKKGRMITNSRFHSQLSEIGLIQPGESEILNLTVADPGVNLVEGGKSKLPREKWPLTKMAESLTSGQSGIDMKGYNDYRGVRVIGVWKWNEKLGFGIVTEIEADNAYSALNFVRLIILLLTFLAGFILIGLTILFNKGQLRLSESEVRFRSLYENSVMGLYRTTPAGEILLANPTLVKMLGFDSIEELKKRDLEEVSYIDYAKRLEFKKRLEENDELSAFESEWYRKDGSVVSVSESAKAVKNRFGNVMYYDGTVEDITARKQAEKELQLSKKFIENIINALPVRVFWKDKDLIYQGCNQAFAKDAGFTNPQEIIGKDDFQLGWRDQAELYQSDDKQVIEQGCEKLLVEEPQKTPDGNLITLLTSKIPLRNSSGEIDGVLGVYMDISAHKKAEEEMKKLAEQYELIKTTELFGYWLLDKKGKLIDVNEKYCQMSGYSKEELLNLSLSDLEEIEKPEVIAGRIKRIIKNGTDQFESRHKTKDGHIFDVEINVAFWPAQQQFITLIHDITERKQAENALIESEKNFRTVIEANPSPILIVQNEHLILANPSAVALTGYSADELIGKNFIELIHPDQRGIIADHAKKRHEGLPVPNRYNLQYVTKNGETRWLDFSPQLFRYNEKPAILATGIDITDKIQLEEQIKKSEHRLRTIFETSPVPLLLSNLSDGSIVLANESLKKTVGINPNELFSKKTSDFYYDQNDRDKIMELLHRDGHIKNFEIRFKNVDGSIRWFSLSVQLLFIDNQKMVLSGFNDITAQKQVEEEIRQLNEELESRVRERTLELQEVNESLTREIIERKQAETEIHKLHQAVEQAPAVVIITDKNGNIEYSNPAFTKITGYTFEEVKGENPRILKSGNHPNSFYEEIWATISSGKVWRGDILNKKKNGELLWENSSISPIFSTNGEITHFVSVKTDITLRKKMEEELLQAKTDAEMANLAKSEFLSRMSHELRTPMNSILGFAQLMDMGELIPAHKRGITHIRKNGKHLLELINEVLDISKIEAGHITLSLEAIEICTIMKDIRDIVSPLLSENNITIEIQQEDNLFVKADFQRLKQVLLNLLNNAIKYNRKNGLIKITCERKEKDEHQGKVVRISISDTGMGIAPGNISKLFTPFERIGAEKTETEGTGLGLAVVKRLTDAMGGNIGVESTLGEGSTFWLDLPFAESPAVNSQLSNSKVIKSRTSNKSGTILYIEDNDSNIDLVEQILKEHRTSISLVTSKYGNNTITLAKEYKPDLILLDLDLPDIHGNEVLKLLQADTLTKEIPVVILSADAMEKQVKILLEAGAKSYLTKPLDVVQFLKMVDVIVNRKKLKDGNEADKK